MASSKKVASVRPAAITRARNTGLNFKERYDAAT